MFRPYDLATLAVPVSTRRRVVEVITHPIPGGTIMVRMVPGEPTTMTETLVENLLPHAKKRWLHIGRVTHCAFTFPEDMLRYDYAFLFDHTIPEEGEEGTGLRLDLSLPEAGLVYTVRDQKSPPWTVDRWTSFSCVIKPVLIRDLRSGEVVKRYA
jgi:hypothetical protein